MSRINRLTTGGAVLKGIALPTYTEKLSVSVEKPHLM